MHLEFILAVLGAPGILGLWDPEAQLWLPHVESYWESWEYTKANFASQLADVPMSALGSRKGVNVINLAFALPNVTDELYCHGLPACVTDGLYTDPASLIQGVEAVHAAGGFVKLAIGGETYGNTGNGLLMTDIPAFVERIGTVMDEFQLDGVDLTQVQNCGVGPCGNEPEQIEIIRALRQRMPGKIISYTFPSYGGHYDGYDNMFEFVIKGAIDYLDYVSVYRASSYAMEGVEELGVPRQKIVWGISIVNDCSMNLTPEAVHFVRQGGYGGVMTWSINSDTNQRDNYANYECNRYQTGRYDATYVNQISELLNRVEGE